MLKYLLLQVLVNIMVLIWVYRNTKKKKVKVVANDPDKEFSLLKENHKKDVLIESLENELLGRQEVIITKN